MSLLAVLPSSHDESLSRMKLMADSSERKNEEEISLAEAESLTLTSRLHEKESLENQIYQSKISWLRLQKAVLKFAIVTTRVHHRLRDQKKSHQNWIHRVLKLMGLLMKQVMILQTLTQPGVELVKLGYLFLAEQVE
jgi:hypothetical protein